MCKLITLTISWLLGSTSVDFVQHCHEDVQPFLELLSALNQTIGCCDEGKLTPTFCGGDPSNLCQDACGDITCVKLVPDPHDSQYCSKSGKHMNVPYEDVALGNCAGKRCPNKRNDNCSCCMSDTYKTRKCKKQCKCRCKCQKYKLPGLCDIKSCSGCKKYDKNCNKGTTSIPEGETNTGTAKSPCLDGTYSGKWGGGTQIQVKGNFTDMQTCADAVTLFADSVNWNHKSGECLEVDWLCGIDAFVADWCSSCPNSAEPGKWLSDESLTHVLHQHLCYYECRKACTNGTYGNKCEGISWNMNSGTCILFLDKTPAVLDFDLSEFNYWCSA